MDGALRELVRRAGVEALAAEIGALRPDSQTTPATTTTTPKRRTKGTPATQARAPSDERRRPARLAESRGLRRFSSLVCAKVAAKGRTTYATVADELVRDLAAEGAPCDDKNVRRRAYDALNVLAAIGVVSKDATSIAWTGRRDARRKVEEKRRRLVDELERLRDLRALAARNRAGAAQSATLALPFIALVAPSSTTVACATTTDRRRATLEVAGPFELHDDGHVVARLADKTHHRPARDDDDDDEASNTLAAPKNAPKTPSLEELPPKKRRRALPPV